MLQHKLYPWLVALLLAFTFSSCEEVAPVIDPCGGDPGGPMTGPQQKQVLIEEFTGVRCVNCPAGSEAIEALLNIHGERLIAVSIHAGFFAVPYPESNAELETETGSSILSLLGEPLGFPTAVVNRKQFAGEENRQIGQSSWPGFIAQELELPTEISIELEPSFNDATGELDVDVTLHAEQNIDAPDVRLTLLITESNISDPQLTPAGTNLEYTHKHVLRTAITAFDGDQLTESLAQGSMVERSYSITLDDLWKPEDCSVVAFVHQGGGTLDVIQAHEVKIIE